MSPNDVLVAPVMTATLQALLQSEKWRHKCPVAINMGDCDKFAADVLAAFPKTVKARLSKRHSWDLPSDRTPWEATGIGSWPRHVWVEVDGRHYDAECPEGVARVDDLPIFARWNKLRGLMKRSTCMVQCGWQPDGPQPARDVLERCISQCVPNVVA